MPGQFGMCPQAGKCPDRLGSVRTVWEVSRQSGKCPHRPEIVRSVCKLFWQPGNCPNSLENIRTVWKLFFKNHKNKKCLCVFYRLLKQAVRKFGSRFPNRKTDKPWIEPSLWRKIVIYAHFYCENLIYALFPRPESFCAINTAIRKVFDFSVSGVV